MRRSVLGCHKKPTGSEWEKQRSGHPSIGVWEIWGFFWDKDTWKENKYGELRVVWLYGYSDIAIEETGDDGDEEGRSISSG